MTHISCVWRSCAPFCTPNSIKLNPYSERDAKYDAMNVFRKQKIISNNRRLVVYIHSYLVLRKLWKTLQSARCVLQSPLWSWRCRLVSQRRSRLSVLQVIWRGGITWHTGWILSEWNVCAASEIPKNWHSSLIEKLSRTSFCLREHRRPAGRVTTSPGHKTDRSAVHRVTGSRLRLQSCCCHRCAVVLLHHWRL